MSGNLSDRQDKLIKDIYTGFGFGTKAGSKAERPQSTERARAGAFDGACVTGLTVEDVIAKARSAKNGAKFADLFDNGNTEPYGKDASRADLALIGLVCFYTGDDPEGIKAVLDRSALKRPKWTDHPSYLDLTIAAAFKDRESDTFWTPGTAKAQADDRAVISLNVDNVNAVGDAIVDRLHERNDPPSLFVDSNGEPVAVRKKPDGSLTVDHFSDHQFRERIMRTAKFEVTGKATKANPKPEPVERTVPLDTVRNVQGRRTLPFPTLTGVSITPTFAADGSVRLETGYDPKTQTYLHPGDGVDFSDPVLDRDPTSEEIRAAVAVLDDLIGDFPFVADADRAHTMVAILEQAGADLIDGFMPMLAFEKPAPGTGASLLVRSITAPFVGPDGVSSITHPKNDEEFEKTLVGMHRQNLRYAFFDNISGTFGTPLTAEAMTAKTKDLRVLGSNQVVTAMMPSFWYSTGNNPTYTDDLPRRIVPVRLDAKTARPWERTGFRHRLPAWAWKNRVPIVRAVLTLWKAWLAAGRPQGSRTLGSYEPWAETMGGVLDVAGIPGFLANTADFYSMADVDGAAWQSVVDAWWDRFGSDTVTVRELLTLPVVSESLGVGHADRKSFGWDVRRQRDRQYGDLKVKQAGKNRDSVQTYQLEHRDHIIRPRQGSQPGQSADSTKRFGEPDDTIIDLSQRRDRA